MNAGAPETPTIRVAVIEDEDLFRDLVVIALGATPGIEVCAQYADGESAISGAAAARPDVAVVDIELGSGPGGVAVARGLRRQMPQLGIVLLSNHADLSVVAALPDGAAGGWSYLLKRSLTDAGALSRVVRGAAAGLVAVDSRLLEARLPRDGSTLAGLTQRQLEILSLMAAGYSNPGIAARLTLAVKSVENQVNAIYRELGAGQEDTTAHPRVSAALLYLRETRSPA